MRSDRDSEPSGNEGPQHRWRRSGAVHALGAMVQDREGPIDKLIILPEIYLTTSGKIELYSFL